ncbi:MAG: hypothetical protein HY343_07365 [Lentisphaerae bacterium]|nr:hypothetical protein [Lentisphaerota bacterium]
MKVENDLSSASHFPQPAIRLGLTLVLGLLGTWLIPVQDSFAFVVLASHHGPALPAWLTAAFAGVILLHRVEHVKTAVRLFVFMGLILATTLVRTPPAGMYAFLDLFGLAKMGAIGLLLLIAGVSVFGSPVERTASWTWVLNLLRGLALAIASPLLLFASRPRGSRPLSPGSALSGVGFVIFLYALASPLVSLGRDHYPPAVWHFVNVDQIGLICRSFSRWAWLGCAVLFVLAPWPETPRLGGTNSLTRANRIRSLAVVGLVVTVLILLAVLELHAFFAVTLYALLLFATEWIVFALLFMVCPWFKYPRLPALGELAQNAKMGSLCTVLFLLLALIPFALWFSPAIRVLVTGKLFTTPFNLSWVGWTLDQSTIQCGFWRFTALAGMVLAYVAVARWLSDRSSRLGYWAFTAPTIALFICLLSYLTCVSYSLLVYIRTLGFTTLRVFGLVYGLGCYIFTLGFMRWALQGLNRKGGT